MTRMPGLLRSRQGVADSLFRLGRHSGSAEGFAALGAARLGPTLSQSLSLRA